MHGQQATMTKREPTNHARLTPASMPTKLSGSERVWGGVMLVAAVRSGGGGGGGNGGGGLVRG